MAHGRCRRATAAQRERRRDRQERAGRSRRGGRSGRLVDELEELGYVERRPDPGDRRGKLVVLTARGHDEKRRAERILADIEARHAARLGPRRYAQFRRLLRELVLAG